MHLYEDIEAKMCKDLRTGYLSIIILQIIDKADEPIYGYSIIKRIKALSDDRLYVAEGTIYVILKSLQNQGLIHGHWGPSISGRPPRKYYEITKLGERILIAGILEWKNLVSLYEQMVRRMEAGT